MVFVIIGAFIIGLMALFVAAFVAVIPWRYEFGKSWLALPLKMSFPAIVWSLTVLSITVLCGGLLLVLFVPIFTVIWYISLILTIVAAGSGIAHAGYIRRVTRPHEGFAMAFGPDWQSKLRTTNGMLSQRWSPKRYSNKPVRIQRDVVIWTFEPSGRQLLADVWQPMQGTKPTGVAMLFFHGSAWHFFDKGIGTDPMFRHLASQGHVIIDVAYRLAPEVNIAEMTSDVKRAVIWTKQNAVDLGIDPDKIVVSGASAGGHISLLAAYGHDHPAFTPADLVGMDTSVAGVISLYAPCDLRAFINHHAGRLATTGKPATVRAPIQFQAMNVEQMMMNLCGGMPDVAPRMFDLSDVKTHVAPGAPPALIFQGEVDFITPKAATIQLIELLKEASVPVVYVELPQTDHVWDVFTGMAEKVFHKKWIPRFLNSQYAPPTQATIYDIERFLGYMASSADFLKLN
ncbi:alpha/beta hydrolase [Cohnella yongneupensis]|uniref:Alpha/beta hydrolase n=1 Tax=Cohnella yongneupensis TaxID=425006 RepID=A0ABW0QZ83_9BACL